jgi:hypothetical protein
MVILQNCLDVLKGEHKSYTETCSTSSGDGNQFDFVNVDDDSVIKQQEDPEPTTPTAVKNDPLVSSMFCVYQVLPTVHRYEGVSKIFWTDAVKIIKLTIRPIGRHYPQSSSLPHVDTGPTVSSIFGMLPGSPFLSDCQALSAIRPGSPQWYQTGVLLASVSFLEIGRSHRVPNQGSTVGGG